MMNYIDTLIMDLKARGVCKFFNKIYLFTYLHDFYTFVRDKIKS